MRRAALTLVLVGGWAAACGGRTAVELGAASGGAAGSAGESGASGRGGSGGIAAGSGFGGSSGAGSGGVSGFGGGIAGFGGNGVGGLTNNDVPISAAPFSALEAETDVVVTPSGVVVATWIAIDFNSSSTNGYAFSTDGGKTWQPPQQIPSPMGRTSSDPVLAVDAASNVHLAWIGLNRGANGPRDMQVYYAQAPAGTTQFGPVVPVSGPVASDGVDKPWIAHDPTTGNLYVTWLDTNEPRMRFAVSENNGASFKINDIDDGQGFRNLIYPCVDAVTGRVHVVYHPGGGIGLRSSDDQGKTWPGAVAVADPADQPAMFDDPTCAANNNELWIAYGIGTDPLGVEDSARSRRIRIAYSNDGGATITRRTFAEDASGTNFLHPPTRTCGQR